MDTATDEELQTVFASRVLEGPGGNVMMRIYCPRKIGDDWASRCAVFDEERSLLWSMDFWGVDSVQALQLALFGLRARFGGEDSEFWFLGERGTGILETIIPNKGTL